MAASGHAVKEHIQIGDIVETVLGEGVVTHISTPLRDGDPPTFEVELGRKWLRQDQVRHFRRQEDQPQVQWHWDEHD